MMEKKRKEAEDVKHTVKKKVFGSTNFLPYSGLRRMSITFIARIISTMNGDKHHWCCL